MKDSNLVVFSGKSNGGALYISGTTIHNGFFTNTDYNTVAGRQSLTSKSSNAYGKFIKLCVVASKTVGAYVCLYTNGINEGTVLYITVDHTGIAVPLVTNSGLPGLYGDLRCFGEYCYGSKPSNENKLKRFSSTPNSSTTEI